MVVITTEDYTSPCSLVKRKDYQRDKTYIESEISWAQGFSMLTATYALPVGKTHGYLEVV